MQSNKDQIEEIGEGLSVMDGEIFLFEKPTEFKRIPDEIINVVDLYHKIVIDINVPGREVNVKEVVSHTKYMFSREKYNNQNNYWLENCASVFRELIMFLEANHYNNAHASIPDENDPRVKKHFMFLEFAKTYLSSIVHFRKVKLMGDADKLYPKQGYGEKSKKEFMKIENDFLEKLCIDVVYVLHHIYSKYCKK